MNTRRADPLDFWSPPVKERDALIHHLSIDDEGNQIMTTETRSASPYEASYAITADAATMKLDRLRLNRASLAAESRLARRLRNKRQGEARHAINQHAKTRIREQARAAHLAWGYVLGKPYASMEGPLTRKRVDAVTLVAKITTALGYLPNMEDLEAWLPTVDEQALRAQRAGRHRSGEIKPRRTREEWEAMQAERAEG